MSLYLTILGVSLILNGVHFLVTGEPLMINIG